MARVAIVGAGYVGVCSGVVLAERGHEVVFCDVDAARLAQLARGEAPFFEPGLAEALRAAAARSSTSLDVATATRDADVVVVCVGTPTGESGAPDLRYLRAAIDNIGRGLRARSAGSRMLVITKSTLPPGTVDAIVVPGLEQASGRRAGVGFDVASNPEFLREGTALRDARAPDRLVVGSHSAEAAARVVDLFDKPSGPVIMTTPTTAEFVKYATNAFLATKVTFANEMANLAAKVGVDWYDALPAIGADPRVGELFLRPGPGFGGSCLPKDARAVAQLGRTLGARSLVLEAVLARNDDQPREIVRMLVEEAGDLRGKRVALLGVAFKPDTDDIRETRALLLARRLLDAGAVVVAYDPLALAAFRALAPACLAASSVEDALDGADAAVVHTDWAVVRAAPPSAFARMRTRLVIDARRTFDPVALAAAGVRYRAVGLPPAGGPA
jgi:UDPglucose 6-dehydrogenase